MKKLRWVLLIIVISVGLPQVCMAEGLVTKILNKMEDRMELGIDLTAKVSLVQERVRQGIKESTYMYHRRDSDDAFIIIGLSPEREKGNGYLRVADNMWMYRKNTRTFQHMSRNDRIGDSNISAESFETRKFTELYRPVVDEGGNEIYTEEVLGEIPVYKFEVEAIVDDVSYPKHTYWVRRDNFLELKRDSYSLSGTLMETAYYLKYTNIDEKYIPVKFIYIDQFEKGNKTICKISGISLKPVDDDLFTKAYLENLSK